MKIDLLNLEPTIVSRDLRGKIVLFYGQPKSGKTSTAVRFPNHLLLGFEKGYNAINNVMAQPINNWREFRDVLKNLKQEAVQDKFETIIIDTVDIAWDKCEEFICRREGIAKIGDLPFGAGYAMVRKEFDEALRSIPLMNYGMVMISHSQDKAFTNENGEEYQKIVPTLPNAPAKIVNRMADIIGYSRIIENESGESAVALYMRGTTHFEAGSRWKHTPDYIEFTYDNLVDAIQNAIEKQAEEDNVKPIDSHVNVYKEEKIESYKIVRERIDGLIATIQEIDGEESVEKIGNIIHEHFGVGRHIDEAGQEQVDILLLIEGDLRDLAQSLQEQ